MSDVLTGDKTFLSLYDQGLVTIEQAGDFVGAWHDSGDEEQRSLADSLGMTDEEYGVWFITRRALPAILAARRSGRPLRAFIEPFFQRLKAAADPSDAPVLHALGYWLGHTPRD